MLHVIPNTVGANEEAYEASPKLHFPLTWSIPSSQQGNSDEPQVTYTLVGRILFHSKLSHYTAQLIIGDRTFNFDSMQNSGVLVDVGRDVMATTLARQVSMVVYMRTSVASVCQFLEFYIYIETQCLLHMQVSRRSCTSIQRAVQWCQNHSNGHPCREDLRDLDLDSDSDNKSSKSVEEAEGIFQPIHSFTALPKYILIFLRSQIGPKE